MLGEYGLTWPWESLHVEALAWYDHRLKGRNTGILDGPRIRYVVPGKDGWNTSDAWPPKGSGLRELALRADGTLGAEEGQPGERAYVSLGTGLNRRAPRPTDPPTSLTWTSDPLDTDLDLVGDGELILLAAATAADTAWIATLQDVGSDDKAVDVTVGWLRAGLRAVDQSSSRPGQPVLPCRTFAPEPIGEVVDYRIPLVANARRFTAGHRVRPVLASDDQPEDVPAIMGFRHASVGTSRTPSHCTRTTVPPSGGLT